MNKERISTRKITNNFPNKENQKAFIVQLSLNQNGCIIYPSNLVI